MRVSCKDYDQVSELAEQNGLETRELTSGANGYPRDLRLCVTGFDTFEQAEAFAKETGGEVTSIRQREGWHLSESEGRVAKGYDMPLLLEQDHECDDTDFVLDREHFSRGYFNGIKDRLVTCIEDAKSLDDIQDALSILDEAQRVADAVECMDDDEFVFVLNGDVQTRKRAATHFHHDVWTHDIAVEYEETEND